MPWSILLMVSKPPRKAKEDPRKAGIFSLEQTWKNRVPMPAKNRVVWISCRGTVVTGTEGHRLLVGRVSELGKKAKADNLTGLRREARFRLNVEALLRDNPESIRYMMRIGIDNFKEINGERGRGKPVMRSYRNWQNVF